MSAQLEKAEKRVAKSPRLQKHSETIFYDWPEGDAHWQWIATAPVKEIVDWAEHVESFSMEDNE